MGKINKEWKAFLLQWILPIGIFTIVMIIVMAGCRAKISSSTKEEYVANLIVATEDYASEFSSSVKKAQDIASAVNGVVANKATNWSNVVTGLESIVNYSDAYMAIMMSPDGMGIMNSGETIDISMLSYLSEVVNSGDNGAVYVTDDEITGASAFVINVPIGSNGKRTLVYYPVDANIVKKLVSVERDYDSAANTLIIGLDGKIRYSSLKNSMYQSMGNAWDSMMKENDEAIIRRAKTKAQSGNSGSFEASVSEVSSLICFAPIPGDDELLVIAFNAKNVARSEAKITSGALKQLTLVSVIIVLFVLTMLTINIVKISVDNKNKEELQDKADNDQLTGLKNKMATEREIKEYMQNHPEGLGMLFLIDIDNFKKINDTMGHAFGDEVLREIGRHIGVNFRVTDVIGRIGGDEFMVFLKNLKEDANTIKEAQKLTYFFKHFQVGDYVKYSVTASIGAAVFPAHGEDFATLYKSADAAVYKSKKRGKNQLSFFDDRDKTPEEVAYADSHLIDIERKNETTPIDG